VKIPKFRTDEEQIRWVVEQEKNPPKVIGYKWKVCDEKVHWELEQFY